MLLLVTLLSSLEGPGAGPEDKGSAVGLCTLTGELSPEQAGDTVVDILVCFLLVLLPGGANIASLIYLFSLCSICMS
jgi:hypothetical protein